MTAAPNSGKPKPVVILVGFAFGTVALGLLLWGAHTLYGRGADALALAKSPQRRDRLRAIDMLRGDGSSDARQALARLARDRDRRVAITAVWAIGEYGDETSGKTLAGVLTDKTLDAKVRAEAAVMLGSCRGGGLSVLTDALIGDEAGQVRAGAASGLGRLRDVKALPALVDALEDRDVEVRRAAIDSIHKMVAHHSRFDPERPPGTQRPHIERIREILRKAGLL